MYNGKTVAVVVPSYNEETQIELVIKTMPRFVDRIVIINDGSTDNTELIVRRIIDCRLYENDSLQKIQIQKQLPVFNGSPYMVADRIICECIQAEETLYPVHSIYNDNDYDRVILITQDNSKIGKALATGYKWCRDRNLDCVAVMAGDGQMDPVELESIISPVINENIDYVKGNRLIHKAANRVIPKIRFWGNSVLSILTKIASGYWTISDTQTGYTAIGKSALESLELHKIYKSYGCPNDILVKLNMAYCTIREVPIKPVYHIGETSKMKIGKVIPTVSWLLLKSFFKRMFFKYCIKDFHPLFLFYIAGIFLAIANIPFFVLIVYNVLIIGETVSIGIYFAFLLFSLFSFQSIGFGMWMDIQDNARLSK